MRVLATAALVAVTGSFASPPTYEATRLVPPEASQKVGWSATDLSSAGMVVGYSFRHAFRWSADSGYTLVRTRPALSCGAVVRAVDDAGIAVGTACFDFPQSSAAIFPLTGAAQDLGSLLPEAFHSEATSISSAGQVAGQYQATVGGRSVDAAFVWDASRGMQRIGDTEEGVNSYTHASGVNREGHVVGMHQVDHAAGFVWGRSKGIVDIPGTIQAHAINDHDVIVGQAQASPPVAFVLESGSKLVQLQRPDGDTGSCDALDVNNRGQVVGFCHPSSQPGMPAHAVLWWPEAGGFDAVDLNVELAIDDGHFYKNCAKFDDNHRGYVDFKAVATNDGGQILVQIDCNYTFDSAQFTMGFGALLLTPQGTEGTASAKAAAVGNP
jgi:hypothetical protein